MKDNFNFNDSIDYVIKKDINFKDKEVSLQDRILKSDDFNETFRLIEEDLSTIYEKARLLQDSLKYTNMQIKNEITNAVQECKMLVKTIEDGRDIIKDNSYVKYDVAFNNMVTSSTVDRDGSYIPACDMRSEKVCGKEVVYKIASPVTATMKSNYPNNMLENNASDICTNGSFRSLYMFNGAISKKIEEKVTIGFNEPVTVNRISMDLCNCNINNVKVKLLDDTYEDIKINSIGTMKTKAVKEIEISFIANNYIVSQLKYNEIDGDFWSKINEISIDQNLYLDREKFYYYLFGIDNIEIKYSKIAEESCFISDEVKIGSLKEGEYITIDEDSNVENGNIEYYIIDGTTTNAILEENKSEIIDEKIFFKTPLRFPYDSSKSITIKKNGNIANMTLEDAINANDDYVYTASYTPFPQNVNIINDSVKVKAIIRNYDGERSPFISSIKLKKHGGGNLWIDNI